MERAIRLLLGVACVQIAISFVCAAPSAGSAPTVTIVNGTYVGLHNPTYNQDFFLGIPYAQPPLGNLRFNLPASLNTSFTESRVATTYSPECVGYGVCCPPVPAILPITDIWYRSIKSGTKSPRTA